MNPHEMYISTVFHICIIECPKLYGVYLFFLLMYWKITLFFMASVGDMLREMSLWVQFYA